MAILSCIISEVKRDIGGKSRFLYILLFDCCTVCCGKTRLEWCGYGRWKNEDMFSRLDRIRACDRRTERRTDRRTNLPQRNARYAFASRVKNSRVCEVSDFWTLQILIALGRKRLHWLSLTLRWTDIKSAQFIIVTPSAWFVCKKDDLLRRLCSLFCIFQCGDIFEYSLCLV